MQIVKFKAGEAGDKIISEGDDGNTAFLIVSGSVDVGIGQKARARGQGTERCKVAGCVSFLDGRHTRDGYSSAPLYSPYRFFSVSQMTL